MKLIRTLLATLLLSVFFTLPQQGFADIKLNGKPISSANGGIKLDSNEDGTVDVIVANDGKLGIGETSWFRLCRVCHRWQQSHRLYRLHWSRV